MGRRSSHSRDELVELVVASATRLIAAGGLADVTVRQIAQDIGYSPGTLYNLFANLDDLLITVAGRTLQRMLDEAAALPPAATPADGLHQLARFYFQFTRTHHHLWRVVTEHRLPEGQRHPLWYRALVIAVLGRVEAAIAPLRPAAAADVRRRSAMALWASMQGICSITQPGSLTAVPERMALELANELIDAFVARWSLEPEAAATPPRSPARRSPRRAASP
jgi:AcrR family transcriptional regulator